MDENPIYRHGRGTGRSRQGGTTRRIQGGGARRPWKTSPNAVTCPNPKCGTINQVPKLLMEGAKQPSCYWCGENVCNHCLDAMDKGYHICRCSRRLTACTRAPGSDWCQICSRNLPPALDAAAALPSPFFHRPILSAHHHDGAGAMVVDSPGGRGGEHAAYVSEWHQCPFELLTTVRWCCIFFVP